MKSHSMSIFVSKKYYKSFPNKTYLGHINMLKGILNGYIYI